MLISFLLGVSSTQVIFHQLYSYCSTLQESLAQLKSFACQFVICKDGDPSCYRRLCQSTVIASDRTDVFLVPGSNSVPFAPGKKLALAEIISWVVSVRTAWPNAIVQFEYNLVVERFLIWHFATFLHDYSAKEMEMTANFL